MRIFRAIVLLFLLLLCLPFVAYAYDLEKGMFLVASRGMTDPRFQQSVVLLIRYDGRGTLGLIVNVPTKVAAAKAFPGVIRFADTELLFIGGPVDRRQFFLLLQTKGSVEGATRVVENVYVAADAEEIEKLVANRRTKDRARVYMGYAGWAPDQLELEIAAGGWHIVPADIDAIFHAKPEEVWTEMIRRASYIRTDLSPSSPKDIPKKGFGYR